MNDENEKAAAFIDWGLAIFFVILVVLSIGGGAWVAWFDSKARRNPLGACEALCREHAADHWSYSQTMGCSCLGDF